MLNPAIKIFRHLFLVFILIPGASYSATYYWINTTSGNWNSAANWSLSTGGPGGAGIPGLTDIATFDGNGNGTCTITANVSLASGGGLRMNSGHTGTINFAAGITLIVGTSHFTQYGGTFTGNNGNVTIQGRFRKYGGTFTCPTGQLDLQGDSVIFSGGVFNHNNGLVRFSGQFSGGNQYIVGNQAFRNVNFHGTYAPTYFFIGATTTLNVTNDLTLTDNGGTGSVVMRTGTVAVRGNIAPTGTNSVTGDAVILINGTANQTITGGPNNSVGHLPGVNIQKVSGTLSLLNFICVNSHWTWTSGTVNAGTSTVVFRRAIYPITITGTHTLNNIEFRPITVSSTYTIAAGTILTAAGSMTYSLASPITLNGTGIIAVKGNIALNNTGTGGGGTAIIRIDGTTNQALTSTVLSGESALCNLQINKSAGTLSITGIITSTRDWTYSAGTINPGTSTVVFISNSTLAQTISGNHGLYHVEFSALAAGVNTYTIAASNLLTVNGNLLISGTNAYRINTGLADVHGNLTVTNTNTNTGGTATITMAGTVAALVTGSGTVGGGRLPNFTINKTSGTTSIATNILSVAGNWNHTAGTVNAAGSSIYFYGTASVSTSAGMVFNNVTIAGTITMGTNLDIDGAFVISSACTFDVSVNNYSLYIGGSWTNNNSANVNSFTERSGIVYFDGSAAQTITLASTAHRERFSGLWLNNTSTGLSTNYTIEIQTNFTFQDGLFTPTAVRPVEFLAGSAATSCNNNSFVNGKCRKYGNTAFTFPIGKGSYYRAAGISAPAVVTDYFTAEYFNSSAHPAYDFTLKDPVLQIFDQCEYWIIDRAGSSSVNVTLSWNSTATPSCTAGTLSDLRVARWDGAMWQNHGNGATTGNSSAGTVQTGAAVTSFSPFTIASANILSPLPVDLLSFEVSAVNQYADISWTTATETDNDYFTIERSTDGMNFEPVARVESKAPGGFSSQSLDYGFTDFTPAGGTNYYRLKQTDFDGTCSSSGIRTIHFTGGMSSLSVFPNPAGPEGFSILSGEQDGELLIMDMAGKIIFSESFSGKTIFRSNEVLPELEPGIYLVNVRGTDYSKSERIIVSGR
ncbi:MAG: hypothetical protein FD123_2027 [Bacteroidetes bacterium]|nr:MAG: hypothetical protein FD123_2027 [Bacteroidota bacterium]